jgi:hypothetical protein
MLDNRVNMGALVFCFATEKKHELQTTGQRRKHLEPIAAPFGFEAL